MLVDWVVNRVHDGVNGWILDGSGGGGGYCHEKTFCESKPRINTIGKL